jgi:urate oxidase
MSVWIAQNSYGKSRVRLVKVARSGLRHEIQNLTINIAFEGDFDAIHTDGDNTLCLPTDTMKNTVYALAGETSDIEQPEAFGRRLAEHFLSNNSHVTAVRLQLKETGWRRMRFDDVEHPHSFVRSSDEKRIVEIIASRLMMTVEAGIEDLVVLKSTGSGFAGFKKDEFTTLPECTDRILSTSVKAVWRYSDPEVASYELFRSIRSSVLRTFAEHDSKSVQHTLYAMGEDILERFTEVEEIRFSLPNIHCLPVDISRFGLDDQNCIFVPTDEPHGLIEATIARQ